MVPWAKADLGAIATQSYANISYGVVDIYLADMKYGFPATAHHAIRGGREHG